MKQHETRAQPKAPRTRDKLCRRIQVRTFPGRRSACSRMACLALAAAFAMVSAVAVPATGASALQGPVTAQGTPFTDLDDVSDETRQAISCIFDAVITRGTSDTTYSPSRPVNRRQMALFLTRLLDALEVPSPEAAETGFTDLGGVEEEARSAVARLFGLGITRGNVRYGVLAHPAGQPPPDGAVPDAAAPRSRGGVRLGLRPRIRRRREPRRREPCRGRTDASPRRHARRVSHGVRADSDRDTGSDGMVPVASARSRLGRARSCSPQWMRRNSQEARRGCAALSRRRNRRSAGAASGRRRGGPSETHRPSRRLDSRPQRAAGPRRPSVLELCRDRA